MRGATCPEEPASAFGDQAQYYDNAAALYSDPKIRPHYPTELFEKVYAFAGNPYDAALDVATGTGQCAWQLASKYKQVWAVDANKKQLQQCQAHPRIQFHKGCAENTGLPSCSVNLVTVATALHWFDIPGFYKEVRRVMKPGGTLAAWCYSFPTTEHHSEADSALREFRDSMLGPHMTEINSRCERQYRGIEPSERDFRLVQWESMPFRQESTVWHLVQLLRTSGSYAKMQRETPGKPDPLPALQRKLMASLNTADETTKLTLEYQIFMILAKDPEPL